MSVAQPNAARSLRRRLRPQLIVPLELFRRHAVLILVRHSRQRRDSAAKELEDVSNLNAIMDAKHAGKDYDAQQNYDWQDSQDPARRRTSGIHVDGDAPAAATSGPAGAPARGRISLRKDASRGARDAGPEDIEWH